MNDDRYYRIIDGAFLAIFVASAAVFVVSCGDAIVGLLS